MMFPKTRNAKNMNTHSPVCMMGVFGPRGGYICGTWLAARCLVCRFIACGLAPWYDVRLVPPQLLHLLLRFVGFGNHWWCHAFLCWRSDSFQPVCKNRIETCSFPNVLSHTTMGCIIEFTTLVLQTKYLLYTVHFFFRARHVQEKHSHVIATGHMRGTTGQSRAHISI